MIACRRKLLVGDRLVEARQLQKEWRHADPDAAAKQQLHALQERWSEAVANVPYYGEMVTRGDAPQTIVSLDAFTRDVPVLTRKDLIDQRAMFQRSVEPHHCLQTAGSTGEPLQFGCFKDEEAKHTGLQQWVARLSNGMSESSKLFLLWGHSHLLGTGAVGCIRDKQRRAKDWLMGYKRVNAYLIDAELAASYFESMRRARPEVVIGYSCALDMFARYNMAAGRSAKDLGIKLCVACSENFPKPDSREILEAWFGCPVLMEYGGVDFGACAHEVAGEAGYRTFPWSHVVEVEGGGQDGAILVTNLTHRYLPLFRYRNGDQLSGAMCRSDGHVTRFNAIEGRIHDVLEMPRGSSIHSMALFHCIHQEPVHSIQLVIKGDERRLRLAAEALPVDVKQRIRARLMDLHPDLADYPIDLVDDVTTNRAGKRRWIVYE
jgi:phenylacetate-CoA ligase